jgi:crotonobetainyl-CoA:carnitine CoA-transferase CaiB-like acyl-CoA transferase
MKNELPLKGLTVLEMGQMIAGPFAAATLAGFGAEVIKIERPNTGDPLRHWRKVYRGNSLWWVSMGRNKKSITLDLHHPRGQELAKQLASKVDIVIENFKPGVMEQWGMGYDDLKAVNPKLIMVRVSGWGQTGPYALRPGFANVAEGVGGIRYTSGYGDRPPVRTGVSLGDTLAGLHAALGALTAVYHRDLNGGEGQIVDVAIYESVFNMMESMLSEYDKFGHVRERMGAKLEGIVPSATYPTRDNKYIIIGANGDSIYKRLMQAAGRQDLAEDPRLTHNQGRAEHEPLIDRAIEEWTLQHTYSELYETLVRVEVPCGPVYSIADIVKDEQYQAREVWEEVELGEPGDTVKIPSVIPKLSKTPGRTEWTGPELGAHNDEIYRGVLGLGDEELRILKQDGVI